MRSERADWRRMQSEKSPGRRANILIRRNVISIYTYARFQADLHWMRRVRARVQFALQPHHTHRSQQIEMKF